MTEQSTNMYSNIFTKVIFFAENLSKSEVVKISDTVRDQMRF